MNAFKPRWTKTFRHAEIQEAFDNLAEFIAGEIEEARERKAGLSGDEGNEELLRKVEDEADEADEDDK